MAHAGKTALEPYQVGVIILSVVALVQTILLVGALVKIVLLTKKSETNISTYQILDYYLSTIISELFNTESEQKTREERLEMDVNVAYGAPKEIMALSNSIVSEL